MLVTAYRILLLFLNKFKTYGAWRYHVDWDTLWGFPSTPRQIGQSHSNLLIGLLAGLTSARGISRGKNYVCKYNHK